MSAALALFTADLRVRDNLVLHAALRGADEVVPLFVLDPRVRAAGFDAPNRRAFLVDRLGALDGQLRERGGRLVVRGDDSAHAGCGVSPCARRTGDGAGAAGCGVSPCARRTGDSIREVCRVVAETGPRDVHVAGDVSATRWTTRRRWSPWTRAWPGSGPPGALD